ncbi:MAG: KH domain-containing protein [Sandaracinaceae bacterium]|nr:KH domain-containing protein [Sandaracinaceae bacterium]
MADKFRDVEGALFFDEGEEESIEAAEAGGPGDGKAEEAKAFLDALLRRMGIDAQVSIREDDARIVLDISGKDAGRAIGKKGSTLDALQFLVNKAVNRNASKKRYVVLDSGDFRTRHENKLIQLAQREAKRALETGKIITLDPMPARDRRVIHLAVAQLSGVTTQSNGEGEGRRVQIIPVQARESTSENRRRLRKKASGRSVDKRKKKKGFVWEDRGIEGEKAEFSQDDEGVKE